jgi:hypothetical protein
MRNGRRGDHGDAVGLHVEIQRRGEFRRRYVAPQVKMRDLAQRVHARIGAAGHDTCDGLTCEVGRGFFQNGLDRYADGLALPAYEGGAVVFKLYRPAGHIGSIRKRFFLKKEAKTFAWLSPASPRQKCKSFLVLFFKKELLVSCLM